MLTDMQNILFKHYPKFYEPIKNIAYDSANDEYPSHLQERMFNFDGIAEYVYGLGQDLMPCSPDALFISDKIYFIEFKNGKLDSQDKKRSLRLKFAEGPYVILARIFREKKLFLTRAAFSKLPKVGIVVYNGRKNPSEAVHDRYETRFQLNEYVYTLYDKIYTFTFHQFNKMVEKRRYPFIFFDSAQIPNKRLKKPLTRK